MTLYSIVSQTERLPQPLRSRHQLRLASRYAPIRGVVRATVYGIYFIMATRPLGYLLPALSRSLKYGEVMGPKWIVLACFIIIIYSWILRLRSSSTCSSMLVGACGSYYSTHMSTILQVLHQSAYSCRLHLCNELQV